MIFATFRIQIYQSTTNQGTRKFEQNNFRDEIRFCLNDQFQFVYVSNTYRLQSFNSYPNKTRVSRENLKRKRKR